MIIWIIFNIRAASRSTTLDSGGDDEKISGEYEGYVGPEAHSDEKAEIPTPSFPDLHRQPFLSPNISADFTNIRRECQDKISSLISLKSRPGSPGVSPWSDSSDISVFTFPGSELSPGLQRKVPPGGRPVSPLVTSGFNKERNDKNYHHHHHRQYSRRYGNTLDLSGANLVKSHF